MTGVSTASVDYRLLERLPIAACVVRRERVLHANAALAALLGTTEAELLSTPLLEQLSRDVPLERGGAPTERSRWLRVRRADGQERTVRLWSAPGLTPEDTVVMMQDAQGEDSVRRLTEALAEAAAEMMRCRDARSVLETAVDAIHRQGFYVTVLLLEGDLFRHGPMRQEPASVAEVEKLYGMPLGDVRIPRAAVPHLQEVLQRRKAAFHPDLFALMSRFQTPHAPQVAESVRKRYPPGTQGLDAPILVEGQPYGLLCIQAPTLTPAGAGTLELFSQLLGGALENVRHHETAAERLSEVARLQDELVARERLTVLGEAAGVVAHEVRNPLGAILNAVAVLRREAHLGPTGQAAVGMLEEEVVRLEDIVKDLLDVVRPLELRPRPVSLGDLVRRALGQLHGPPDAPTLRFTVDEAPDTPLIEGDETLLLLAVTHLVRNAVQASPSKGEVWLTVGPLAGGVCLVVEDQGPGIPDVAPQRIFEPFFLTRANGRGLGLAIVRRVVLAHGGTVRAMGRPEGGARFEVHLPLAPSRRTPA